MRQQPAPHIETIISTHLHAPRAADDARLHFRIVEGRGDNLFLRQGPVAVHALASSGERPRFVAAFPAGNSGVAVWFDHFAESVSLSLEEELQPVSAMGGLHGASGLLVAGAGEISVLQAVLGSVRILRDYKNLGAIPESSRPAVEIVRGQARWVHTRPDGKVSYELVLKPRNGSVEFRGDRVVFTGSNPLRPLELEFTALSSEPPLTPVRAADILTEDAGTDEHMRNALEFLAFREKYLAGSWRFLTYFGRDTLISMRLLMPVLTAFGVEIGVASVLDRLSPSGDVAHEEDIGEFAVLAHKGQAADPVFDYKMIDDDFLLAPLIAEMLELPEGEERFVQLLGRRSVSGFLYRDLLVRHLERVLDLARPYANEPCVANLRALKDGLPIGDWRDSHEGLGGGRYPYNVNAVLIPAALRAAERLFPLLGRCDEALDAAALHQVWCGARQWFSVELDDAERAQRIKIAAGEYGVPENEAPSRFHALALDAEGRPLPVMHSDYGFDLLYGQPDDALIQTALAVLVSPFPGGLLTPVGMVVANGALASEPRLRHIFSRNHYHGAVIWSWQQAMALAGIERQLNRTDLRPETRAALLDGQAALWAAVAAGGDFRNSELWTWRCVHGRFEAVPFGQDAGHTTESNAVQLWSTVFLALEPRVVFDVEEEALAVSVEIPAIEKK